MIASIVVLRFLYFGLVTTLRYYAMQINMINIMKMYIERNNVYDTTTLFHLIHVYIYEATHSMQYRPPNASHIRKFRSCTVYLGMSTNLAIYVNMKSNVVLKKTYCTALWSNSHQCFAFRKVSENGTGTSRNRVPNSHISFRVLSKQMSLLRHLVNNLTHLS